MEAARYRTSAADLQKRLDQPGEVWLDLEARRGSSCCGLTGGQGGAWWQAKADLREASEQNNDQARTDAEQQKVLAQIQQLNVLRESNLQLRSVGGCPCPLRVHGPEDAAPSR
jgi:hypothetical protein